MEKDDLIKAAEQLRSTLLKQQKEAEEKGQRLDDKYYKAQASTFEIAAFFVELHFKDVLKETPLYDEVKSRTEKAKNEQES